MAQKIVLIDDIDGSSEATKTVRFSLNDRTYEIDLSDEHVQQLDAALAPYIANGREAEAAPQPALVRRRGRPRRTPPGERPGRREDFAAIRAWAREHNLPVSERGRVAQDVIDAYHEAQARGSEQTPQPPPADTTAEVSDSGS